MAIPDIAKITKDERTLLDNMMNDIYSVYLQIVDILAPFYEIRGKSTFRTDFKRNIEQFENEYIDQTGAIIWRKVHDLHIRCGDVEYVLLRLSEKNGKKGEELRKIQESRKLWFLNDTRADIRIEQFFNVLYKGLKKINSYEELRSFLSDSYLYFEGIRNKLIPFRKKREELYSTVENTYIKND